jgi:hypothetical protein
MKSTVFGHDDREREVEQPATIRPSGRTTTPPPPGSEDAAFLDNLNEVYGEEDTDPIIAGLRRHARDVLADTR